MEQLHEIGSGTKRTGESKRNLKLVMDNNRAASKAILRRKAKRGKRRERIAENDDSRYGSVITFLLIDTMTIQTMIKNTVHSRFAVIEKKKRQMILITHLMKLIQVQSPHTET